MFTSGFFNSLNHDRTYDALQMSSIFDGIIRDGVFMSIGGQMRVFALTDWEVVVDTGRAWFDHTWSLNTAKYPIDIPPSHMIYDRIDAVVLEVNHELRHRTNYLKLVKGAANSDQAVKPELIHTDHVNQYPLAYIYVPKRSEKVLQGNIENTVGTVECPYVTGILETITFDDLIVQWKAQWEEMMEEKADDWDAWLSTANLSFQDLMQVVNNTWDVWFANSKTDFENMMTTQDFQWTTWFEAVKKEWTESVTVKIQNEIDALKSRVTTVEENLSDLSEKHDNDVDDILDEIDALTKDLEDAEKEFANKVKTIQESLSALKSELTTEINKKQNTITGAATTITDNNLTKNRAVVSDANGKVGVSSVTDTELGYLSGTTGNVQTQLDGKLPSTTKYALSDSVGGQALKAAKLHVSDNRNDNQTPIWYMNAYGKTILSEFKIATAIGLSGKGGNNGFIQVTTFIQWSNSSGGYPSQLATGGSDQGIYYRTGRSDTEWKDWIELYSTANEPENGLPDNFTYAGSDSVGGPARYVSIQNGNEFNMSGIKENTTIRFNYRVGSTNELTTKPITDYYFDNGRKEETGVKIHAERFVGTADKLLNFVTTTTTSNGLDTVVDSGIVYTNGTSGILGQGDGALYRHVYSGSWVHQIYGDYRTGQIAVRGKNNGTWQAWRRILDSTNYADFVLLVKGAYTGEGGAQPPSYIPSGKVRFNMMNAFKGLTNPSTLHMDTILMDTYTGSDVPYVTGIGITKNNGVPRMFIANGAKGNATTWAYQTEVITADNVNNYVGEPDCVGKTGYIAYPKGGTYDGYGHTSITGYLRVQLPVAFTNTMIKFTVSIFNYLSGTSVDYIVSGYNYSVGEKWYQITAIAIGKYGASLSNLDVRFGTLDGKAAITIGEASTVWEYPNVSVHDITYGYQNATYENFSGNWTVSFSTTGLSGTVVGVSNTGVNIIPDMSGASSTAAGEKGLVPAPAAGNQKKYLRGDGTWQTPPDTKVGNFIEFTGSTNTGGYIDFHYGKSTEDYTSRIIEDVSGKINISPALRINGSDVVSHLTATGTSGNWRYWKWSDGLAICIHNAKYNGNFPESGSGSVYAGSVIAFDNYPFAFFETPTCYISYVSADNDTYRNQELWYVTSGNAQTTKPPSMRFMKGTNTTIGHPQAKMTVIGRWK